MKKIINYIAGLGVAVCGCGVISAASIVLAFIGPERSGKLMATPPALGISALIALLLILRGFYAVFVSRFHSALLHLGCACVVSGFFMGQLAPYVAGKDSPVVGAMAMVDGDVMNALWEGTYLTNYVGKVPFTVKLDKFIIDYYESSPVDQNAGRMPPIKEYRSRVTITESGKEPYSKNIRVNQPIYVGGYHIYQMSWGQSQNWQGQPITYTVLQFIRDPGLPVVYAGFVILLVGILFFCIRIFRVKNPIVSVKQEVNL